MPGDAPTPSSNLFARALSLGAAALFAVMIAPVAQAAPAEYAGSSASGDKVFFTTAAKLVPGDTDNGFVDVYERFYDEALAEPTYVTREISTGPTGGNDSHDVTFNGVSTDGTKVFFSTAESLVGEDTDRATDVYMRNTTTGETKLVSPGEESCAPCGNRETPVAYAGATPSGSKVFFTTDEVLATGDGDESSDIYVRNVASLTPTTTLASPGGAGPVAFDGASEDGTKVVFESSDKLAAGDGDTENDIYERDLNGGTTKLVSATGTCPAPLTAGECAPIYRATSADGSRVFFETKARLLLTDQDNFQDVYEWSSSSGSASLISTSSEAEEGDGENNTIYAGASSDGTEVFFETSEKLAVADGDIAPDVYRRSGAGTSLISAGADDAAANFDAVSSNGSTVLFSTAEALSGGDTGEKLDVYKRTGGTTTLVTPGSAQFDAFFAGSSDDASKVFYSTSEKLSPADSDLNPDVYEWAGGAPVLVSTGPAGGNGAFTPHLSRVSGDGNHAFFTTRERLTVDDDFSGEQDVYDHSAAGTLLVSIGNSGELQLGPPAPGLTGTNPASPSPSTEPRVLGEAENGTSIKIYPTADCSGPPAGTGSAAELLGTGIRVTVKAGVTTTFHATATNGIGDTSGCSTSSVSYRQESAPSPPEGGEGGGSAGGGAGGSAGGGTGDGSTAGGGNRISIGGLVYVTPQTRITFGPAFKTRARRPVFRFIDATEQPGSRFFCRVDRQRWKGCSSPVRVKRLGSGKHVFAVKSESAAGQIEPQPVMRRFKVVGR
jgi:Tol biopolymer transport system component